MTSKASDSAAPDNRTGTGPVFSVLIVNYNGGAYVQDALDSLAAQTRRDFEVILLDNASTDGSISDLETSGLPRFTLMAETENHGYARGMNLAAARAEGQWLVGLNPDALANPDWLNAIMSGIARYPGTAMFASAQFALEDPETLDGAGDAYLIFGMPWRGGFGRPASELPGEGECFRLRLAGETCMFLPDAVIHHVGGGITGRTSDFSTYHGCRNRVWTYAKDMPSVLFWLTLPGHVGLSLYLLMRGVMTGRVRQSWRGMRDGLKGAAGMRKSGQALRRARKVALWDLARAMAWNPFRMSKRRVHVRELEKSARFSGSSASEAL